MIFAEFLSDFEFQNHSFLGIGVLPEDIKYVSFKNKLICSASLLGPLVASVFPFIARYSDSIYIKAIKRPLLPAQDGSLAVSEFLNSHNKNPTDNLNLLPLLQCPLTGHALQVNDAKDRLINEKDGFFYPIIDTIPILIADERQGI